MREKIINYLKCRPGGSTPTNIGLSLGKKYSTASSSVSYWLKKLKDEGVVKRYKINGRVIYKYIQP